MKFFRRSKSLSFNKTKENNKHESETKNKVTPPDSQNKVKIKPLPKIEPMTVQNDPIEFDSKPIQKAHTFSFGNASNDLGSSIDTVRNDHKTHPLASASVAMPTTTTVINTENFKMGMSISEAFDDISEKSVSDIRLQDLSVCDEHAIADDDNDNHGDGNADKDKISKMEEVIRIKSNVDAPKFLVKGLVYNGFGGWVCKKKVKTDIDTQLVVIKTFKRTTESGDSNNELYDELCHKEYRLMNSLKNKGIAQVLNLFKDTVDESGEYFWSIALPYYPNGDLLTAFANFEKIGVSVKDSFKDNFFKQMVESIRFLHRKKIVHGDVKLDNFLIDNNYKLKLTDFGMSIDMNKFEKDEQNFEKMQSLRKFDFSRIGTKSYRAPEVFLADKKLDLLKKFRNGFEDLDSDQITLCENFIKRFFDNVYKLDIWSLAICYIYMVFNLHRPWDFADKSADEEFGRFYMVYTQSDFLKKIPVNNDLELDNSINNVIQNNPKSLSFLKKLSFDSKTVILNMLHIDPEPRLDISRVFESNWVTNINFCSNDEFANLFGNL